MNIALKEWSAVVKAFAAGQQTLLLRKGGIAEEHRGGFELRHREFLLFPTFEHQHQNWIREPFRQLMQQNDPQSIDVGLLATVTDIQMAPPKEVLLGLTSDHIWNQEFLDMRYAYKPEIPLRLLILRIAALQGPMSIPQRPSYAGCKSWVNLTEEIDIANATPVLDDADFASRRARILAACQAGVGA